MKNDVFWIRNPLLYPAELRALTADSPPRMVGTIGNGKIVTNLKNTSVSGLASVGPEIVVDQSRGWLPSELTKVAAILNIDALKEAESMNAPGISGCRDEATEPLLCDASRPQRKSYDVLSKSRFPSAPYR